MVERCQRRLKDAFRARLAGSDWPLHLPWVLMGLRAAPTEDTGVSAAEIVFGPPLVLPGQILDAEEPLPADFITKLWQSGPLPPSCPLSYGRWRASRRRHCYQLHSCTSPRAVKFPPCRQPYKVLVSGPKVFQLQMGKREESVSIDSLKPHWGAAPVQPAQPPARGWPPAS
jgi:hypothetical protein